MIELLQRIASESYVLTMLSQLKLSVTLANLMKHAFAILLRFARCQQAMGIINDVLYLDSSFLAQGLFLSKPEHCEEAGCTRACERQNRYIDPAMVSENIVWYETSKGSR
ncbi:hypothetical protein SAMN05414139_02265 [Burkholderia sp. D7]|nr:hypothetical protein SAMN05414139_02265 [Burkholderia sp. D7]